MSDSDYVKMDYIEEMANEAAFLLGTKPLGVNTDGIPAGDTQSGYIYLEFDEEKYGYGCIEEAKCIQCSGAECSGMEETWKEKWEGVNRQH